MSAFLASNIDPLRWCTLFLALANLLWAIPAALRGIRGNLEAECGYAIAWTALLLGMSGAQIGFLFEGIGEIPHWRIALNLLICDVGLVLALVAWWIRALEVERRHGRTTPLRRLLKGMRRGD